MRNIKLGRSMLKPRQLLSGVGWAILGVLALVIQPVVPVAQGRALLQITPTPTTKPIPKFLLRAAAGPSPKVDGIIGDKQVQMKANLPSAGQAGVPFFGDLFKFTNFRESDLQDGSRGIFIIRDANGNEVYKRTERNLPFCLFGDSNRQCNNIPSRDGYLFWPESDGQPTQAVQPGRYFLSAAIKNGDSTICSTIEDFVFDIGLEFETPPQAAPSANPVLLPASAGSAAIIAPGDGLVWQGVVSIRGTATLKSNFAYYKLEFEDARCGVTGGCFIADARSPIRNGVLLNMDTRKYPNGNYLLRLLVVDRRGRVLTTIPRVTLTIQN